MDAYRLRTRLSAPARAVAGSTERAGTRLVDFHAQPCDPFRNINPPAECAEVHALPVQLEGRA
jgi:molybdopterin-guanine dinucleotide biosynthesis protein A